MSHLILTTALCCHSHFIDVEIQAKKGQEPGRRLCSTLKKE